MFAEQARDQKHDPDVMDPSDNDGPRHDAVLSKRSLGGLVACKDQPGNTPGVSEPMKLSRTSS
jgi:hypothetical protein